MNPRQNRIVGAVVVGTLALGGVASARSGAGGLPQSLINELTPLALYPGQQQGIPGSVTYVEIEGVGEWSFLDGRSGPDVGSAPVTLDSVFGIGSVTKTFTATAVLRLIADGSSGLTLDDTLSAFDSVPTLPNDDEITIAQLLQHTSGIADYGDDEALNCIILPSNCPGIPYAPATTFTPEQLVEIAIAMGPVGPPGQGSAAFHYSNTNYVILGMILEELTGQTAADVIAEEVIEPLGLEDTAFPTSIAEAADLLTTQSSFVVVEDGTVLDTQDAVFNPTAFWTAGAMVSSARDLASWAEALTEGRLLPLPLQLRRLQTIAVGEFPPLPGFPGTPIPGGYGLGIADFGGYLGHNGIVPAYQSIVGYDPETKTTVVQLLNAWAYDAADQGGRLQVIALENAIPTQLFPSFVAVLTRPGVLPSVL